MSERILPGVSIREVTEGLTGIPSPGAIAIKLVGTSCKGSLEPQFFGPGEISKFSEKYGPIDPYHYSTMTYVAGTSPHGELTLRRAGDLIMAGAAPPGGIWVCRVASSAVKAISNGIAHTGTDAVDLTMTAAEEGGWYNNFEYTHDMNQDEDGNIRDGTDGTVNMSVLRLHAPSLELFDSVMTGTPAVSQNRFPGSVFTFEYESQTQSSTALISDFVAAWNEKGYTNTFVAASTSTDEYLTQQTTQTTIFASGDTMGTNWSTDDQASVSTTMVSAALNLMRAKDVRLTVIAGASEETSHFNGLISIGEGHVNNASKDKHEQLFVCGTKTYTSEDVMVTSIITDSSLNFANARVVKVTPGFKAVNPFANLNLTWAGGDEIKDEGTVTMSGGYAAAYVAGLIANYVPDQSPMNKPVGIPGSTAFEYDFSRASKKRLIKDDFFLLADENGRRTILDITTAGEADAFHHVSTRMAVDDIKYAIRLAGKPFIGMKNIPRILMTLKKNLEFVLQGYAKREIILDNWSVSVSASRTQQILGVVDVTLVIQPVFYIKFIEVTLVLE